MAVVTETKTVSANIHLPAPNFSPRQTGVDTGDNIPATNDLGLVRTSSPMANSAANMLDVRKARMRTEEDVKLLANRLEHLKMETLRTERKTLEAQARTEQIMFMKDRNVKIQEKKNAKRAFDEQRHLHDKKKLIAIKAEQKRHLEMARRMVDDQRKSQASAQREKLKKLKEDHKRVQEEKVEQKRRQNNDMRARERTLLERRDRNRTQHQARLQQDYQKRVEDEARRQCDAQRVVVALEEAEAELARQLERKQKVRHGADVELKKHTPDVRI